MIAALVAAQLLGASPVVPAQAEHAPGSELTIYLMTFGVGAEIWERFGHNALWVHDPVAGTDYAYDYGRFDFRQEHFFLRFAAKDLRYWTERTDNAGGLIRFYRAHGRNVWIQELDLPAGARLQIRDFVEWNIREEHKYYQYDYYLDNCSTRIRDIIDRAVGGAVKRFADSLETSVTFRSETRRLTENNVALYTLLMVGLGQPTDHRLVAWEQMFLPIALRPYLNQFTVTDPDGRTHPLVKTDRTIFTSDRYAVGDRPAPWTPRFWLVGALIGGGFWLAGRAAGGKAGRRILLAAGTAWALLAGVFGVALLALWGFTAHQAAYWNENIFQFNLLSLGLAIALPRGLRKGGAEYQLGLWLAGSVAATAAMGLVVKVLPAFSQANLDVIGLALPIHLGLFLGLLAAGARRAETRASQPTPAPAR